MQEVQRLDAVDGDMKVVGDLRVSERFACQANVSGIVLNEENLRE